MNIIMHMNIIWENFVPALLNKIPVNRLQTSGLQLPSLGFGAASLGNLYRPMPDADAGLTLKAALDAGMVYIDTAPHYGQGLSERRIGTAISELTNLIPTKVVISTKVGRLLKPITPPRPGTSRHGFVDGDPFEPEFDYSYDGVMRSFEESQKRLKRVTIDILFAHDIGKMTHGDEHDYHMGRFLGGGYKALLELKAAGLTRAIGLGVNEWQVCEDVLRYADLDVIMLAGRYTLLEQTALDSFLPLCERRGVSVLVAGPFNSGILTGGTTYNYASAPPDIVARVTSLRCVCDAYGVPLAAAALQFPIAHPAVACVVAGMGSPSEAEENVRLFATPIPYDFWADLKTQGLLPDHAPVPLPQMETS
jgi:D-threo-aldose 1-dehydrogenase